LPAEGSVLDIGCGGGAASFALVPPATSVTGVDSSQDMLADYAATAARLGVDHTEILGVWPDVAAQTPAADVVACHHVLYNVADITPFVDALTRHARRRVVVELTERHPLVYSAPMWRHFHGLERPTGPSAALAVEALRDAGIVVQLHRWARPPRDVPRDAYVRLNRRRLCLPVTAEPEVDRVMGDTAAAWRDVVTLWWDV
jgi:SAM-dependent methyltransferase